MNILEIKNFSKTYKGNKKAVDNLSITVEAGDIYGFIGHNGAEMNFNGQMQIWSVNYAVIWTVRLEN